MSQPASLQNRLGHHWGLIVICSLFIGVAVLYGVSIPIFETPDANGHYAYIHELTEGRGLPVQGTPSGERVTGYVASHPPLYYALSAALTFWNDQDVGRETWGRPNPYHALGHPGAAANKNFLIHTSAERFPWRGTPLTMHIARLVSTALATVAVVATYGTALELFPRRRWLALGASALTAFNPMFVFTGARVSNDAAVAAFGSLVIWGSVRLAARGLSRRGLALTGAALGLAALSKLSGIVLAPVVALALLLDAIRNPHDASSKDRLVHLLVDSLITFGTAALICGWWFGRNLLLYGELLGTEAWLSHTATVRPEPIALLDVIPELRGLEMSYWAMFGWFNVPVAPWMYRFWWVMVRLAALGLVPFLIDQVTKRQASRSTQAGLLISTVAFLLTFGSVWRFIMIVLGAQGRYLMPAVASISTLLMLGLARLVPRRWHAGLAAFVGLSQLSLALIALFAFIRPAYATPPVVQEHQLPEDMERVDLGFQGTSIQLLGGEIEAESAHPGDTVPVNLYWRASEPPQKDFVAFVQILGRDMEPIAGVDCYPGRGNFPPTLWQPGAIYRDRYHLPLATDMEAPTSAALHAGLYARGENKQRLTLISSDQQPLDMMLLDRMAVRPPQQPLDEVTHPVGARLGETITLVGYDVSSETVKPGETLTVTLVWRAESKPEADWTAFVHLLDDNGHLVAQDDHPPLGGAYPTSLWAPGDIVRDPYHLTLGEDIPSLTCTLAVGMYNPRTGERAPAYNGLGERFKDDAIKLQVCE